MSDLQKMSFFNDTDSQKSESLGMSKSRSGKKMITEIAIKKVPFIQYPEIPRNVCDVIYKFAQQVLKISKEKNDSNEVTITYSYDSEMIAKDEKLFSIYHGEEHSINPMADAATFHLITASKECAVVSIHNHPSESLISLYDIKFFLCYSSIKLLVVVSNLGNITYLVKTKKFNYSIGYDLVNQAITLHNQSSNLKGYQKAAKYFLKNCYKAGIIYGDR